MKSYIFLKNICGLQAEFTKKKGSQNVNLRNFGFPLDFTEKFSEFEHWVCLESQH